MQQLYSCSHFSGPLCIAYQLCPCPQAIGGFNQRQGEALPPRIFLTLKFVVCIAFKIIEIVATWCNILRPKGSKFDFGWAPPQTPLESSQRSQTLS